ncbi:hypothetical protein MTO96_036272 [Rhipicephalus appendiculatus]
MWCVLKRRPGKRDRTIETTLDSIIIFLGSDSSSCSDSSVRRIERCRGTLMNPVYLGSSVFLKQEQWAWLLSRPKDSLFCKEATKLRWGVPDLGNRSLTGAPCQRFTRQEETRGPPSRALTPRKLQAEARVKNATPPDEDSDYVLDNHEDDPPAQALFPPRNEADMGIRNLRTADMLTYCLATNRAKAREVIQLYRGFDYILTSNLLVAIFCFGELSWDGLTDAGVFSGDSEHYRTTWKALSDTAKKTKNALSDDDRVSFHECAALFGAMCPPVPGWDPIFEIVELASGGPCWGRSSGESTA